MFPFHQEDLRLLNIVWLYKAGCINNYDCMRFIDMMSHSFEKIKSDEWTPKKNQK